MINNLFKIYFHLNNLRLCQVARHRPPPPAIARHRAPPPVAAHSATAATAATAGAASVPRARVLLRVRSRAGGARARA